MSSNPWFAWFPADFQAKTRHLNLIEKGAYRELIDCYMQQAMPITSDRPSLMRIVGAVTEPEQRAVERVVEEFFVIRDNKLIHSRCDEEIAKRENQRRRMSEAGKRGGLTAGRGRPIGVAKARSQSHTQSQVQLQEQGTPIARSDSSQPLNGNAVAYIPLIDKTEFGVSETFLRELELAYPAVDGPATLREIRAWCVSNPRKLKTKRGVSAFINRWFEKVQNHG
jgi:uncharacterized protein YdaU (DUF1376 family)